MQKGDWSVDYRLLIVITTVYLCLLINNPLRSAAHLGFLNNIFFREHRCWDGHRYTESVNPVKVALRPGSEIWHFSCLNIFRSETGIVRLWSDESHLCKHWPHSWRIKGQRRVCHCAYARVCFLWYSGVTLVASKDDFLVSASEAEGSGLAYLFWRCLNALRESQERHIWSGLAVGRELTAPEQNPKRCWQHGTPATAWGWGDEGLWEKWK